MKTNTLIIALLFTFFHLKERLRDMEDIQYCRGYHHFYGGTISSVEEIPTMLMVPLHST